MKFVQQNPESVRLFQRQIIREGAVCGAPVGSRSGLRANKVDELQPGIIVICMPEQLEIAKHILPNSPLCFDWTFGSNKHMVRC